MIQELHICNFQSHKDTRVAFHPGINVITGPSDSGKTAIIRALRKLVWNRPLGDSFCSHWGGVTEITAITAQGTVEWEKGKADVYRVNGAEFRAFKTEVPQEVREILQMSDVNIQQQLDSPFLLSSSPGEVAAYFNQVAGLDIIDTIRGNLRREETNNRNQQEMTRSRVKSLKEGLNSYEYLERAELEVEVLERMEADSVRIWGDVQKLEKIISEINALTEKRQETARILTIAPQVVVLYSMYQKHRETAGKVQKLDELLEDVFWAKQEIEKIQSLYPLETPLKKVIGDMAELERLKKSGNELAALSKSIRDTVAWEKVEKGRVAEYEKTFRENFPDICPLCRSRVKKEKV